MMLPRLRIILILVVSLAIAILTSNLSHLSAKPIPASDILAQRPQPNPPPPPPPPDRGAPGEQRDSGTRAPCEKTAFALKPLLPITDGDFSGYTLKEHPTFWFYVPYKVDSASQGEFVLEDTAGNLVNHVRFKLPQTPGFVGVNLSEGNPLEKNQPYIWRFLVFCSSQSAAEPGFVIREGLVERVDVAGIETQLERATLEERIQIYADNKLWYDISADLVNIRNRPQAWLSLLRATGLEQLHREAIAGEVVPVED